MTCSVPKVVLIGAAHVDRVARAVGIHRFGASNPGVSREDVGGACFNASRALVRLGAEVHLISARGCDPSASTIEEALRNESIGDGSVVWLDRCSATYTAVLDEGGDLVSAVADMAIYDMISPRILRRRHIRERLSEADAISVDANLPETTLKAIATDNSAKALFAIGVSPAKVIRLTPILPHLSALFVSKAEAEALCGSASNTEPTELAWRLHGCSLHRAVITDGPRSVVILDGDRVYRQEPPPVDEVQDVTGAGDTLAATTINEFLSGVPFVDAVRTGMAAASIHISNRRSNGSANEFRRLGASLTPPTTHTRPEGMA